MHTLLKLFCFLAVLTYSALFSNEKAFDEGLSQATYYQTPLGHSLRYAHFVSSIEGPKHTVFFLQGRGTSLELYGDLIIPLLNRGFDVWMYDLPGQGGSSRILNPLYHDPLTVQYMQHIDSFDLYLEDARAFLSDVVIPNVVGNLYLGGYSTGGHLALRLLQDFPELPFHSAFVISPLLAIKTALPNSLLSSVLWSASFVVNLEKYMPGAGHEDPIYTTPFEGNIYTSDEQGYLTLQELCIKHKPLIMGGISIGWVKAATDSLRILWSNQKISIPVLIATGGDDGVVDVSYNDLFARMLPHFVHVFYPEGRHELFRETPEICAQWWADFDTFIK